MKRTFFLIALLLHNFFLIAQNSKADSIRIEKVKDAATKMARLFLAADYTKYVDYVHPKIVTSMGGKQKMINILKKSIADMKENGFVFLDMTCEEPSAIITNKKELQAVVPQIIKLKVKEGTLTTKGYLIAISSNGGNTWHFIDTSNKTLEKLKETFPDLSNQLILPERTQPELIED